MALGWAVGFLFGVPRVGAATASARINTNLEQISDWLTKILVGVGLTQLQQLPKALRDISTFISKGYGTSGNDVFSLSMVLYFSTLGFLTGYLLTRLALQKEFDEEARVEVNTTGSAEIKVTQPAQDGDTVDKDTAGKAAAAKDVAAVDAPANDAEHKAGADNPAADPNAADQTATDKAAADTAAADQTATDKAAAANDAAGKPAADRKDQ